MMKAKFLWGVALMALATSCAQEETTLSLASAPDEIGYKVDAGGMTRATSAYTYGSDIQKITVSAWLSNGKDLPGYGSGNTGNSSYFLNDVLVRTGAKEDGTTGVFNYTRNARYWPHNGETLDFYAVVDNENFIGQDQHPFGWTATNGHPGLEEKIKQGNLDEMPDLLYAVTFNQWATAKKTAQQNVKFDFKHAFAKVIVTAETKNKNLRVVITDMEIHGIKEGGVFSMPYKSGEGETIVYNDEQWTVSDVYTDLPGLLVDHPTYVKDEKTGEYAAKIVLDKSETAKQKLVGEPLDGDADKAKNTLFVIPTEYNGRNSSKHQTYIQLKGYAYNKAGETFDPEKDVLVYGDKKDGKIEPAVMTIPIEFDWKMGTVNKYNITFDCGNGGSQDEDPNHPALVRIGYEVEVNDWIDIDPTDIEYNYN